MKNLRPVFALLILTLLSLGACKQKEAATEAPAPAADTVAYKKIVSLSGALTENLFALGLGQYVIGVDVTSTYPEAVKQLPSLGHVRQLNAEAILALQPDLIVAEAKDSSMPSFAQLSQSGIKLVFLDKKEDLAAAADLAKDMHALIGGPADAVTALEKGIQADRDSLQAYLQGIQKHPKVLFLYARGRGNLMVGGTGTPAENMITAAGGVNAVSEFADFQALSTEGLLKAQPDVILMFDSGLQSLNGVEELLLIPGVAETPAGKNKNVISMEGHYLLGFGPRAVKAALELAKALQSEAILSKLK